MTLSELIERVEKLDGPSREVDFAIYQALRPELAEWQDATKTSADDYWFWMSQREYTASLDAAIALTERVLAGWFWRAGRTSLFPKGWAYVSRTHPSNCDREDEASSSDGKASSPAIALVLATLRALSAQERDDGR